MASSPVHSNPFHFGNPVEGSNYLPRSDLSRSIAGFIENKVHVVLIGPRRFGKTSFCLDLLKQLEAKGRTTLYVDIFNVTSHRDFLQQWMRALKSKKNWMRKLKEWTESLPKLRPKFNWNTDPNTGEPTLSLSADWATSEDPKELIQDLLAASQQMGKEVVVCIDEFQRLAEIEDGGWLEATLRSHMQQMKNVAFLFTGSRKGIISDMLNNANRPFYRSCQPIEFPAFGAEFTEWIVKKFDLLGIQCDPTAINALRKELQETPNYVQMACFHLVALGYKKIDPQSAMTVLRSIVKQNAYAYQTLLNTLTLTQQRTLRLCANHSEQVYAKELGKRYEIASGAALHSAIKMLKDKQILDEGSAKGRVIFDDPLFAIWLRAEFQEGG